MVDSATHSHTTPDPGQPAELLASHSDRRSGGPSVGWPENWRYRIGVVPAAVAIVLVGVAVGVTVHWEDGRLAGQQLRSRATFDITVGPEMTGGIQSSAARIEGQLRVLNDGPLPILIESIRADQPGFTVASLGEPIRVGPGQFEAVNVLATTSCSRGIPNEPIRTEVTVVTPDKRVRRIVTPVTFGASSWPWWLFNACHIVDSQPGT